MKHMKTLCIVLLLWCLVMSMVLAEDAAAPNTKKPHHRQQAARAAKDADKKPAGARSRAAASSNKAAYNFGLPHRVTDLVNITITQEPHQPLGSIIIALFGQTAPKAVTNFKDLCTMRHGYGYVNSTFHRVLKQFIVQGGDFQFHNGSGGHSIYHDNAGQRFTAENFNIPHRQGSVAMAAEKRTRLGSQFYIVAANEDEVRFLNGKHVVFGHVVSGLHNVVQKMAKVQTSKADVPRRVLRVVSCTATPYMDPHDAVNANGVQRKKQLLDDEDDVQSNVAEHHASKREGPTRQHPKAPPPPSNAAHGKKKDAPAKEAAAEAVKKESKLTLS